METAVKITAYLSPIVVTALLYAFSYEIDTEQFLTITVQLVWGILFALGGAIVFLSKFSFTTTSTDIFRRNTTNFVKSISFPLVIYTLSFIFISIFYPARQFLKESFKLSEVTYIALRSFADSLLTGLILIPAIGSIFVGMWCIFLAIKHESK